MHSFAVFVGVAALVTVTPGPATALVLRSALRGGRRTALLTTFGNASGVFFWGAASALGIAALLDASELAFLVLRLVGACTLIALGLKSLRRPGALESGSQRSSGRALRDGAVSALANPKLALFFLALFPQFVSSGRPALATGLAMASLIVVFDLVWFSTLALVVTRARHAIAGRWPRRLERLSGGMLIGLGASLALESR